jgi:uncharacterized protein (UPF0276 family)
VCLPRTGVEPFTAVHLPNINNLIEKAGSPEASIHLEWALSCKKMHPHHLLLYWDHTAARRLLEMVSCHAEVVQAPTTQSTSLLTAFVRLPSAAIPVLLAYI